MNKFEQANPNNLSDKLVEKSGIDLYSGDKKNLRWTAEQWFEKKYLNNPELEIPEFLKESTSTERLSELKKEYDQKIKENNKELASNNNGEQLEIGFQEKE